MNDQVLSVIAVIVVVCITFGGYAVGFTKGQYQMCEAFGGKHVIENKCVTTQEVKK